MCSPGVSHVPRSSCAYSWPPHSSLSSHTVCLCVHFPHISRFGICFLSVIWFDIFFRSVFVYSLQHLSLQRWSLFPNMRPYNGPWLRKDSEKTETWGHHNVSVAVTPNTSLHPPGTLHHSSCPALRPHYSSSSSEAQRVPLERLQTASSSRVSAALVSRKTVRGSGAQNSLVAWTWVSHCLHMSLSQRVWSPSSQLLSCWAVRGALHPPSLPAPSQTTRGSPSPLSASGHATRGSLLLLAGSKHGTWTPSWPLRFSISAEPTQPPDHPPEVLNLLCRFLGRTPELPLVSGNVLFPSFRWH